MMDGAAFCWLTAGFLFGVAVGGLAGAALSTRVVLGLQSRLEGQSDKSPQTVRIRRGQLETWGVPGEAAKTRSGVPGAPQ